MKKRLDTNVRRLLGAALIISFAFTGILAFAANDPSIKGELRERIKGSMMDFIDTRMIDDTFFIYDALEGKLLNLKFDKLHDGIIKKGNMYVSCADFFDGNGKKVDLDFLVMKDGDRLKTVQAVVHSVDGKKRKYHLES